MLHRTLSVPLHRAVAQQGTVLLQGPRSAGKTTLLHREFPGHHYVSMEQLTERTRAREDPERFLSRLRGPAILDDLHRAPELMRYLARGTFDGPLIAASSRRLPLPVPTFELYPPTLSERQRRPALSLAALGRFPTAAVPTAATWPAWDSGEQFLEKDVRDLVHVHDLDRFVLFYERAKEMSGNVLDQQALARECGVAHRTAVRWLEVLERCFVTLTLPPSEEDFGRRLIRRPKLHLLFGGPFESRVVSELYRNSQHAGETPEICYWRDSNGLEIPLLLTGATETPMPVMVADTPKTSEFSRLNRWMRLANVARGAMIGSKAAASQTKGILRYSMEQL